MIVKSAIKTGLMLKPDDLTDMYNTCVFIADEVFGNHS